MAGKEKFDLVMLAKVSELTLEERQFRDLHNQICYSAQQVAENFYGFLQSIRKMKEGKFYHSVGFHDFGEYAEIELGIKKRQAYNYVEVAEKLPEDFIRGNASLGVTKLQLLTTLDEKERDELMKNIDLKKSSVEDVKGAVAAEKAKREEAEKQLSILQEEKKQLEKENDNISSAYSDLANEKKLLEKELKKAQSEPTIVYQQDLKTVSDLEEMTRKAEELKEQDEKKSERIKTLENELKGLKEKKSKTTDEAKLKLERKIKELEISLEEAKTNRTTISSDKLIAFKVRFDLWQKNGAEMLLSLNDVEFEKQANCRAAVEAVLNKLLGDLKK